MKNNIMPLHVQADTADGPAAYYGKIERMNILYGQREAGKDNSAKVTIKGIDEGR